MFVCEQVRIIENFCIRFLYRNFFLEEKCIYTGVRTAISRL